MPDKFAEVICPNCGKRVVAYRGPGGRILITTSLGIALAVAGGIIGAGFGIATGGWGIPATVPLAAFGLVVGAGAGYIIGDKTIDRPKCPKCGAQIDLGI
ncbi:MAG: hypothetical protein AB1473_13145 [Thermodesulfobacteriota bacterium]